mmetsp:Transcript_4726/g.11466  ORF Transcript_4726/g.11466 Transcript_4726/m.11466 type:complete len:219 (-) Transcript_4726:32-688(-)
MIVYKLRGSRAAPDLQLCSIKEEMYNPRYIFPMLYSPLANLSTLPQTKSIFLSSSPLFETLPLLYLLRRALNQLLHRSRIFLGVVEYKMSPIQVRVSQGLHSLGGLRLAHKLHKGVAAMLPGALFRNAHRLELPKALKDTTHLLGSGLECHILDQQLGALADFPHGCFLGLAGGHVSRTPSRRKFERKNVAVQRLALQSSHALFGRIHGAVLHKPIAC